MGYSADKDFITPISHQKAPIFETGNKVIPLTLSQASIGLKTHCPLSALLSGVCKAGRATSAPGTEPLVRLGLALRRRCFRINLS